MRERDTTTANQTEPKVPAGLDREQAIAWLRPRIAEMSLANRFRALHLLGIYRGGESISGDGSSLGETERVRRRLPGLFRELDVARLLDIPCGDFHWLSRLELGAVDYTGADIVPELVANNRSRHERSGRRFVQLDITADPLPKVDLVLCRDLLIHLSLADIARALSGVVASGSRYLLTNHYRERTRNEEIESGDFRPVNLCAPPFELPPPREIIDEGSALAGGELADKSLALWQVSTIAAAVERAHRVLTA